MEETADEMRISDWSSDWCSSDLPVHRGAQHYNALDMGNRQKILKIGQVDDRIVVARIGVIGGPPAAAVVDGDHPTLRCIAAGEIVEVLAVAGQARQAQPRQAWRMAVAVVAVVGAPRSEERRVGQGGVRTGRSRG